MIELYDPTIKHPVKTINSSNLEFCCAIAIALIAIALMCYKSCIVLEVLAVLCKVVVVKKPAHAGFSFAA